MEVDPETKGNGNSYTTEFRQYDPRLGRWLSLDPKAKFLPWQSPYCAMDNNPIKYTDPKGDITDKEERKLKREEKKLQKESAKLSEKERKWAENYAKENEGFVTESKDDYGNKRYAVQTFTKDEEEGDIPNPLVENGEYDIKFEKLNERKEKNLTALYGYYYEVGDLIGIQLSVSIDFFVVAGASYSLDYTMVGGKTVMGYTVGGGIGLGTGVGLDAQLIICTEAGRYNAEKIQDGKGFEFSVDVGPFSFAKAGDIEDDEPFSFKWDGTTNNGYGGSLTGIDVGEEYWTTAYTLIFRSVNAIKAKVDIKYQWTTSGIYVR